MEIACNLGAIAADDRNAHIETAEWVFSKVLEIKALFNGYAFRLPLDTPTLKNTVAWLANERLCCPFFNFGLEVGEQFWLSLTGTPEVKTMIEIEILPRLSANGLFPTEEAKQAWIAEHTP